MPRKETLSQYERSAADRKADSKAAKKRHEPVSKWEGSPADRKADKKAVKAINKSLPPRPAKSRSKIRDW